LNREIGMKALRILGIALGILVALVAIGIGLLFALFDGEKLKSELSRVVLEQKQRKLDIAGKVELSLWPEVALNLGRVSLSEPGGKQEFAALDSARVAVAVLPLLSKQVQVQRIEVAGLKATLVKHKDGTLNIADLVGGAGAPTPAEVGAGGTASTPVQLDIAGIRISNAQLTWRDEKAGTTTALSRLDIGSGRIRADGAQRRLDIDALAISATGKTGADNFELKLEAPRLQLSPEKSSGETLSLSAQLAGSGRNLAAKLVLSGVEGSTQALKIGKLALELDAKAGEATRQGPPRIAGCGRSRGADAGAGEPRRQDRHRQPADADEAAHFADQRQTAQRPGPTKRRAGTGHPLRRFEDRAQAQCRQVRAAGAGLRARHRPAECRQVPATRRQQAGAEISS
jgi:AsmA protein